MSLSEQSTRRSAELFERAQRVIPGGVNSPVRAFKAVGGQPRFFARAQGPRVWDADGNEYLDYMLSWGPLILGHAGSGVVTLGLPDSPGVPAAWTADTLVAPFNDLDAVESLFKQKGDAVAAVVVEPVVGNVGVVPPRPGFLERLRTLCDRHGA